MNQMALAHSTCQEMLKGRQHGHNRWSGRNIDQRIATTAAADVDRRLTGLLTIVMLGDNRLVGGSDAGQTWRELWPGTPSLS